MSDTRNDEEPITGHDPTNGLAGDLEGDDGGAADPTAGQNTIQEVIADLDPDQGIEETGDGTTSYSEEGKP